MDAPSTATKVITHTGIVSGFTRDAVLVRLSENIHCEGCRAKAVCGVADAPSKEIEVMLPGGTGPFRGPSMGQPFKLPKLHDPVEVVLRKELGLKAVFWAYVFPFILVLLTLLSSSLFLEEWQAGLLSLLVLIPYYGAVAYHRDFFRKTFRFTLNKNPYDDGHLVA